MRILFATSAPVSILLLKGQGHFNKSKGAEVFFASSRDAKYLPTILEEGFEFKELAIEREIALVRDFKAVLAAIKIIKEVKPDVVNASTPKAGLIFMIACFFTNVRMPIFTLRGLRSSTLPGLKGLVVRTTERLSCLLAKKVIVISPSLLAYAVANKIVNRKKAIVIGKGSSNGINVSKFNPDALDPKTTLELKTEWGIPQNAFIFGYLGRIVQDKGVVEMYHSFQMIKDNNIFLVLVGDYEVDDAIPEEIYEEMCNDVQVRIIPFSNNVPLVISTFDVLILFSYREGFGNVALEASCMGKPILVSNIVGLCDTVEHEVTGFKITSKDSFRLL
jgi:glycosyltransferase involved in cell wall biosynthesis